jgi:hypothetical protein
MAVQPGFQRKEARLRWVVASFGNVFVDIGLWLTEV